ncbi:MAG: hypothetical protein KME46_33975 [Brasilonema angustatum HA4187-MV1]|jgi:hypothetical protein|nr:hypothetical protein [Brasilonema angustatum HA4187-MV1]
MYIAASNEEKRLVGRPKRDDYTERANLKLNSEIRKLLKNSANINGRSESAQVERFVVESEALARLLKKNPDLASRLLPSLNEEINLLLHELL